MMNLISKDLKKKDQEILQEPQPVSDDKTQKFIEQALLVNKYEMIKHKESEQSYPEQQNKMQQLEQELHLFQEAELNIHLMKDYMIKLKQQEQQAQDYETQIQNQKKLLQTCQDNNNELQQIITQKNKEHFQQKAIYLQQETHYESIIEKQTQKYQNFIEKLNQKIKNFEEQISQTEITLLQNQNTQLKETIKILNQDILENQKQERIKLYQQEQMMKVQLQIQFEKQLNTMSEERNREIQQQYDLQKQQYYTQLEEQFQAELQTQLQEKIEQINQQNEKQIQDILKQHKQQFDMKLKQEQQKFSQEQQKIKDSQEQIEELQDSLNETKKENKSLKNNIQMLKDQCSPLQEQIKKLEEKNLNLLQKNDFYIQNQKQQEQYIKEIPQNTSFSNGESWINDYYISHVLKNDKELCEILSKIIEIYDIQSLKQYLFNIQQNKIQIQKKTNTPVKNTPLIRENLLYENRQFYKVLIINSDTKNLKSSFLSISNNVLSFFSNDQKIKSPILKIKLDLIKNLQDNYIICSQLTKLIFGETPITGQPYPKDNIYNKNTLILIYGDKNTQKLNILVQIIYEYFVRYMIYLQHFSIQLGSCKFEYTETYFLDNQSTEYSADFNAKWNTDIPDGLNEIQTQIQNLIQKSFQRTDQAKIRKFKVTTVHGTFIVTTSSNLLNFQNDKTLNQIFGQKSDKGEEICDAFKSLDYTKHIITSITARNDMHKETYKTLQLFNTNIY